MRHYALQDPNDRSPNSPAVIASSTRIRALYNQANPDDKMENITQKVKEWFTAEALKGGWDSVSFAGSDCVLTKSF